MKMSLDAGLENWDPMSEEFSSGKKYQEGPGADLQLGEENSEVKIFIKNIPPGLTVKGMRNLCLSAATSFSVYMSNHSKTAVVQFKTLREAELAIRDLNNTPPYFLKVSFNHPTKPPAPRESEPSISENTNEDKPNTDELHDDILPSWKQKLNIMKNNVKNAVTEVSPYFKFRSQYDNPSLIMRQSILDFITKKECISMGRGYLNMGNLDYFKIGQSRFSCKSPDWDDSNAMMSDCPGCGSMTYGQTENFCSKLCSLGLTQQSNSKRTVIDIFKPGLSGSLEPKSKLHDIRISCTVILDETQNYRWVKELSNKGKKVKRFHAKKGDKVLVSGEYGFRRAVVCDVEHDNLQVTLMDDCEMITVRTVYVMPEELEDIPSFGCVATFIKDCSCDLKDVTFHVKERKPLGSWLCNLIKTKTKDVVGEILLEKWTPPANLTHIPLEPRCNVIISSFKDMKTVFVRRIDSPWHEDYIQLSNDIAACSIEGVKYKKLPRYGEVCSARYSKDGCYYRAVVRGVKRQSVIVVFMDYGNEQETKLEDLVYLPISAKQINCFAVRVRLKNVTESSSPGAVDYINRLTSYGTELLLTYDGDDSEVVLTEKYSGDVVNKVVADAVVPPWEKDPTIFTKLSEPLFLESVGELSFQPGKTEDIFLLNFDEQEFNTTGSFWSTPYKCYFLGHLNGELKQKMTEYCNYLIDDPYLPRAGEVCLVDYKGDWYRGVSLDDRNTAFKVFLIDFGLTIEVETKKTRKIIKDFIEMPALALECTLTGMKDLKKEEKKKITEYMKNMDKKCIKDVKVCEKRDGVYHLSIPFVEGILC